VLKKKLAERDLLTGFSSVPSLKSAARSCCQKKKRMKRRHYAKKKVKTQGTLLGKKRSGRKPGNREIATKRKMYV